MAGRPGYAHVAVGAKYQAFAAYPFVRIVPGQFHRGLLRNVVGGMADGVVDLDFCDGGGYRLLRRRRMPFFTGAVAIGQSC